MSDPGRPPLDRLIFEQIEMLLDRVDQDHWPMVAAFQVDPAATAKRPLPLPKTPMSLLSVIRTYASVLFKREVDHYEQFSKDRNYAPWLVKLEERVIARVFRTIGAIQQANSPATLAYHGLTDDEIMQGLGSILWEIRDAYIWKDAGPKAAAQIVKQSTAAAVTAPGTVSVAEQLRKLLDESHTTAEEVADEIGIEWRTVYRHLSGENIPRKKQAAAYERFFSKRLRRPVKIVLVDKRQ